jgi:invasion protein IalB
VIPPGVQIKIGDKDIRKLGYSLCLPDHCVALHPA